MARSGISFPYPRPQIYERPRDPYSIGNVQVVPADAPLGAEIRGVDFSERLTDPTIEALYEAWADHLILLWRGQELSIEDQMGAGRIFGELEEMAHVAVEDDLPPEILLVDNEPDLNKDLASAPQNYSRGLQAKPLHWHSDNSYREVPPRGSLFYMHVAPEAGGVTHFLNMYDAYNDLPGDLIAVIEGRWSKQDRTLNSADTIQPGRTPPTDVSMADNVAHPLARIHPATGRIALYLGRRQYQYICGHSVKDSETLLDRLWTYAQQEKFVWRRQDQRAGDLILWDNRCAMHSRDPFDPNHRRIAHRVQMAGEPIVAPWPRADG
jgi:taurine dioxygenase